ncbi:carbonic anhydrase [Mucilaginibacter aquariorum]|uniref:Carbonic anhydrase n=1 Tax=Mucilaginibacter aquariorum TaxID=2967225 RepID=A0ABT1SVV8_9SPHI|nr:carbonic anhydrase [Mucilaginibacter aquariorum]MCQ6956397.1 carbonic anhydrase [Mucilaginibacter aquariorum]
MKKLSLVIIVLFTLHYFADAQKVQPATVVKKHDHSVSASLKWGPDHYIVNRDSAFTEPRLAIKKLMGGNRRFVENKSIRPRQDAETIKKLGFGQKPFTTIVSCSDSRVPNEIIFDQGVGDLFVIRTAGQVSSAASYGSMEYAVIKLYTRLIVVLGHTECGAVAAAVQRPEDVPGHIVTLINEIKPAVAKVAHMPGGPVNNAVRQNVIDQVNSLRNLDPILHKKYSKGEILIVGAVYDIHTGKVEFLKETLHDLPEKKSN